MQDHDSGVEPLGELPTYASIVQRFGLYEMDGKCNPQVDSAGVVSCTCLHCFCWHAYVEGRMPEGTHVQYEVLTREFVHGLAAYLRQRAAVYHLTRVKVLEVGAGDGRLSHFLKLLLTPLPGEAQMVPVFEVVATDSGQRGLASGQPYGHEVREQDAVEAIRLERPHIVIASWQPLGVDWTAEMRQTGSVLEYLLIGEKDGGICGHPWLTWGVRGYQHDGGLRLVGPERVQEPSNQSCRASRADGMVMHNKDPENMTDEIGGLLSEASVKESEEPEPDLKGIGGCFVVSNLSQPRESRSDCLWESASEYETREACKSAGASLQMDSRGETSAPPYAIDGFDRYDVPRLSHFQISRTDERWSFEKRSFTVSFRRHNEVKN